MHQCLIERGVLDINDGDVVGFVVDTTCNHFRPQAFSVAVATGIRVARIGKAAGLWRRVKIAARRGTLDAQPSPSFRPSPE